jgi:hypothetical protein
VKSLQCNRAITSGQVYTSQWSYTSSTAVTSPGCSCAMKELQQQNMKKPASVIERWKMMLAFLNDETTFNS